MDKLLRDKLASALGAAFGTRLAGVILYGSEARGQADEDSDIDLLVLLTDGPTEPEDSWRCIETVYPLVLECGRPIHAEPINVAEYRAGEFPLYRHAQREGILL